LTTDNEKQGSIAFANAFVVAVPEKLLLHEALPGERPFMWHRSFNGF